jgi:hypothetical protein
MDYKFVILKNVLLFLLGISLFIDILRYSLDLKYVSERTDSSVDSDKNMIIASIVFVVLIDLTFGFIGIIKENFFSIVIFSGLLSFIWILNAIIISNKIKSRSIYILGSVWNISIIILASIMAKIIRKENILMESLPLLERQSSQHNS